MPNVTLVKAANTLGLGGLASRLAINSFATNTPPRPRPFSMWSHVTPFPGWQRTDSDDPATPKPAEYVSDYTAWPSLVDRGFSARHLPPAEPSYQGRLQDAGKVAALFSRSGPMKPDRSSALFAFFAQWFTDSILRFDSHDRRRNTSNHDIDLCQIYGLTTEATRVLRENKHGRLKSDSAAGEELPVKLCAQNAAGEWVVKPEFTTIVNDATVAQFLTRFPDPQARRQFLYATGLERGNSSIGYVAVSVIFLREHNRLCGELAKKNPSWGDERLFQTARLINITLLLKLVVEDYINHILGGKLFRLEPGLGEDKSWYRPNWIAAEFDLLYRWHGLMPDTIAVGAASLDHWAYRNNNALIEQRGLSAVIDAASRAPAGRIGLFNSPDFLQPAELNAVLMGRAFRLQPYNAYRKRFGLSRIESFGDLTADAAERQALEALYASVDDVEYLVGIFAEGRKKPALFGDLLTRMVAYDAFTQIFSNPLLSKAIWGKRTFTSYGLDQIEATSSIQDLVDRNLKPGTTARARLGL